MATSAYRCYLLDNLFCAGWLWLNKDVWVDLFNFTSDEVEVREFVLSIKDAKVISEYGLVHNPTLNRYELHLGVDIEAQTGMPVYATRAGTITNIIALEGNLGPQIDIVSDNGFSALYRYLEIDSGLAIGDYVEKGKKIGTIVHVADNEYAYGPHLHFELFINEQACNPRDYLDFPE